MNLIVVGMNHRTAPVDVREKLGFPEGAQGAAAEKVKALPGIRESLVLSTCNRVEVYAVLDEGVDGHSRIIRFLSDHHGVPLEEISKYFYSMSTEEAIRHIFRVASSLDSMVQGEPQILGQVKEAYAQATERKATGAFLHKLFHRAFSVAKEVRSKTSIASYAVSVSYAAVELAKKIFGILEGKSAVLVGAGEMGELAARHLISAGASKIAVMSRTYERAARLAETLKGVPLPFDHLVSYLREVDIVICSAAAPHYIILPDKVNEAMRLRKGRPMFFIDISVPRNIDPRINDIDNVYLYDIDDLEGVVADNVAERKKEAEKAEAIAEKEAEEFIQWLEHLDVVPTIVTLKKKIEKMRRKELDKTLSRWKNITPRQKEALESLTAALVKKILHTPVSKLKENKEGEAILYIEALKKLFDLDED